MLPQNFTTKSQEAIQRAHMLATENSQQQLEPIHLLHALLDQEEGIVVSILKKLGSDNARSRSRYGADLFIPANGKSFCCR